MKNMGIFSTKKDMFFNFIFKKTSKLVVLLIISILFFISFSPILYAKNSFAKNNLSYAVMDQGGYVYLNRNLNKRIYPASLTKIAIGIVAIEELKLDKKVKIEKLDYKLPNDYVLTPVYIGEVSTVKDLLYASLLKSGNDASLHLAKEVYGSNEKFIIGINRYLEKLGLKDTHFNNPFGLADKNHYTTPHDMLILAKHAMSNKTFKEIVSKERYTIPANDFSGPRIMVNTSMFSNKKSSLYNKTFYGIKTGYTEDALNCFVTAAKINDKEFYFLYTGIRDRVDIFLKIEELYDETKSLSNQKTKLDDYAKARLEIKKLDFFNISKISKEFFFNNTDKLILILFVITIFLFTLKPKKKRRKRK